MSLQIKGHMESHLKHAGQLAPLTNCEIFRSKVGRFPPGFQRKKGELSNFNKSILNGKDYTNQIPTMQHPPPQTPHDKRRKSHI